MKHQQLTSDMKQGAVSAGFRFANQDALYRACVDLNPESYLEVGTWLGWSLEVVVNNAPRLSRLAICDLWDGTYECGLRDHAHIAQLLAAKGYCGETIFLDGDSHLELSKFAATNPKRFDVIHIDGDHSIAGAMKDLEDALPLLRVGGYLVFDDILSGTPHPPASKYRLLDTFNEFCSRHSGEVSILHVETEKQDGYGLLMRLS